MRRAQPGRQPELRAADVARAAVLLAWMVAYVWVSDLLRTGVLP